MHTREIHYHIFRRRVQLMQQRGCESRLCDAQAPLRSRLEASRGASSRDHLSRGSHARVAASSRNKNSARAMIRYSRHFLSPSLFHCSVRSVPVSRGCANISFRSFSKRRPAMSQPLLNSRKRNSPLSLTQQCSLPPPGEPCPAVRNETYRSLRR